jgi:hypothetical protein
MLNIPIRIGTSIRQEIEAIYDDIPQKACEMALDRYGADSLDVEDWLAAENQLLRKPEIEMTDVGTLFLVRIGMSNIDPATVNVVATPHNLVLQSIENAPYPRVFRAIQFPLPIDPAGVRAIVSNGRLFLVAPRIGVSECVEAGPAEGSTQVLQSVQR